MIVAELIAKLGFEFDDADIKKFDGGMVNAKKLLIGVGVAAVASAASIFAFTKNIAETNDELGKQAQILGLATAELQEWNYVAELGGASSDTMTASLTNLSKIASETARGIGGGVEIFGMLGISATKANGEVRNSSDLMGEISDKISQLGSQSQKIEYLEKLGISSDLLLTLNQGSEALNKQRKEAEQLGFTLNKTATKDAAAFNDEFLRVSKIFEGVTSAIASDLMPEITKMMTIFKEWFIHNKKIIKQNLAGFLNGMVKAIKVVWNVAKRLYQTVDKVITAFGGWELAVKALGTALLIMNAKALLIPISLVAIGVGIALLLEDLVAYFSGADSAIGDLVAKFPLLEAPLHKLKDILLMVGNGWSLIFTQGDKAIEGLLILVERFGKAIYDFVMTPINKVSDMISSLTDFSMPEMSNPFASGGSLDFMNPFSTQMPQAQAITSNNQSVASNQSNNIEINIHGSTGDAKNVANSVKLEVQKVLNENYKQAHKNLRSGVIR